MNNKLSFDEYLKNIWKKVNIKLRGLVRATPYIEIGKHELLPNVLFYA